METNRPAALRYILAALLAFAGLPGAAANDAPPKRLVCFGDLYIPYFFPVKGGMSGINVDVLREAAARSGIQLELRRMPWKRLQSELASPDSHGVECAFAMSRTAEREQYLEFGAVPMWPSQYNLFVRTEAGGIEHLDDLHGKTIGVRAGFRLPEVISAGAASGRWSVAEVGSDQANFQKLGLKRIDAVLIEGSAGLYLLKQMKLHQGVKMLTPPLMRFDTYLVFKKSGHSAALAATFDQAFEHMNADGTMDRMRTKYLAAPLPPDGR